MQLDLNHVICMSVLMTNDMQTQLHAFLHTCMHTHTSTYSRTHAHILWADNSFN